VICQACGVEAPTRKVFFVQHIGALVMFFHKRIGGMFCRNCAGVRSKDTVPRLVALPGHGAGTRGCQRAAADTDEVIQRLNPLAQTLVDRLNKGEKIDRIAPDIGAQALVTPGQVVRYVQALVARENKADANS
jgi:hypothetical protein